MTDFKKTHMAAHQFERDVRPYTLGPTGAHLHKEEARRGTCSGHRGCRLPGGVMAGSVTSASLVRKPTSRSAVKE